MDSMENAVLVGDTVIIQTCGRLNWADGKKAKVEKVDFIDKELVVQLKVDWLDPNKPPFGKIDLYGYEVQRITDDNVNHPSHYTDGKYECIVDRTEAIKTAIEMATKVDIIVLAGKGHETYQEINHEKHPYDERIVIKEILKEIKSNK